MSSLYSVIKDSTLVENFADGQLTASWDTTSREQMISQAEMWVSAYTGVTWDSTAPDAIKAAVIERSLYHAKMRLTKDGNPTSNDAVYGIEGSLETQSGGYERQAAEHKRVADELVRLYGRAVSYVKVND